MKKLARYSKPSCRGCARNSDGKCALAVAACQVLADRPGLPWLIYSPDTTPSPYRKEKDGR